MILPIVAYGAAVLRKKAQSVAPDYPQLQRLIKDMWETMYASNGVGLAAPQVNYSIRLFIVNSVQILASASEKEKLQYQNDNGVQQVFINPIITKISGEDWLYNEGCLSIPNIREDVYRGETIEISYHDAHFQPYTQTFYGLTARIILHEYDHLEGKLFIDYLKPLKKKLLRGKLENISKGKIKMDYKMLFVK